jgi:hypothetical protein
MIYASESDNSVLIQKQLKTGRYELLYANENNWMFLATGDTTLNCSNTLSESSINYGFRYIILN